MSRRKRPAGFTLIEMVVAVSLSSIVLLGVFYMATSMVQTEVNGMRTGTVTAWTLIGLNAMNASLSGASAVSFVGTGSPDVVEVCTNWSNLMTHVISPPYPQLQATPSGITITVYCYDTNASDGVYENSILQSVQEDAATCPMSGASPIGACTFADMSALGATTLVASGVYNSDYPTDAVPVFTADATPNTVDLAFTVGLPTGGASAGGSDAAQSPNAGNSVSLAVPKSVTFQTKIVLED